LGGPRETATLADCTAQVREKARRFPDPAVVGSTHRRRARQWPPKQKDRPKAVSLIAAVGCKALLAIGDLARRLQAAK